MILYEDGFIKLDYDNSTGILCAVPPDIEKHNLIHVHKAFGILVDTLIKNDVKKLLIDGRHNKLQITEEDYKIIIGYLGRDLLKTHLQRIARVASQDAERESWFSQMLHQARKLPLPFTVRNFTSKKAAEKWLSEN